jgi:hypothetical protein
MLALITLRGVFKAEVRRLGHKLGAPPLKVPKVDVMMYSRFWGKVTCNT